MVDLPGGFQLSRAVGIPEPLCGGADHQRLRQLRAPIIRARGTRRCSESSARAYADFLSKSDLEDLVNGTTPRIAGTLTPAGRPVSRANQRYPVITLPSDYRLGDIFSSQDLRLTKSFGLPSQTDLRVIGEVFNIFNMSNLTNFNYNLVVPATFGKANQRVGQTFGSGGPRAFQIAARFSF